MWFVLRYYYDFLPSDSSAEVFKNEYLSKTGKLGAIYFDWLCSFEEEYERPSEGTLYRAQMRRKFAQELMLQTDLEDLLFTMTLGLS